MANPLMNIFGGMMGGSGGIGNVFMQAVGSMMRGESPQDFMRGLANTNPKLRGLDLSDINATAQRVCQEHGVDPDKLTEEIKKTISSFVK